MTSPQLQPVDDFIKSLKENFDNQILIDRSNSQQLNKTFRASGISSHPRESVLELLNLPEDKYSFASNMSAKSIKLMQHGTDSHRFVQEKLINMGLIKKGNLEEGLEIMDDEFLFSGHPDGVLSFEHEDVLLEIKTINNSGFKWIKAPKQEHFYQAQAYMYFLEKLYGFKIKRVLFVYIDRSDDDMEMKPFLVDREDKVADMILNKLKTMKDHINNGTIPAIKEGEKDMGKWSKYNTPVFLDPTKNSINDFPGHRIIANVKTKNIFE